MVNTTTLVPTLDSNDAQIDISNLPNLRTFLFLTAKFYIKPLAGFRRWHNFNRIIHGNWIVLTRNKKKRECTVLPSQSYWRLAAMLKKHNYLIGSHGLRSMWQNNFVGLFLKNHVDLYTTDKTDFTIFFRFLLTPKSQQTSDLDLSEFEVIRHYCSWYQ